MTLNLVWKVTSNQIHLVWPFYWSTRAVFLNLLELEAQLFFKTSLAVHLFVNQDQMYAENNTVLTFFSIFGGTLLYIPRHIIYVRKPTLNFFRSWLTSKKSCVFFHLIFLKLIKKKNQSFVNFCTNLVLSGEKV